MKIRTKVLFGFTLLLGVVLAQVLVEYHHAIWAKRDLVEFEHSSLRKTVVAGELTVSIAEMETTLALVAGQAGATGKDWGDGSNFDHSLSAAFRAISIHEALPQETGPEAAPLEESLIGRLGVQLREFEKCWLQLHAPSTEPAQRVGLQQEMIERLQHEIKPLVKRYDDNSIAALLEQSRRIQKRSGALVFLFGTALTALVITVLASYWLRRSVTKPLNEMANAVQDITLGDHKRRLVVRGKDEFAVLATSFNRMLDQLEETNRARDALRGIADARAEELDDFFYLSMDVLGIANAEGVFVRINPALVNLLGYPTEEILGRSLLDFVHPEDQLSTKNEAAKLARGESCSNFENRCRCSDGTWKWLSWQVRPRPSVGLYYAVAHDVTDKKNSNTALLRSKVALGVVNDRLEQLVVTGTGKLRESEEHFRMLVEGVKDYAITLLDAEGRVATWNLGAERLQGYSESEIVGRHFSKFYPAESIAQGRPAHGLELARSTGRFEEKGWRVCQDGRAFLAHVVITAIYDAQGVLRNFAEITRDITAQHKAEEGYHRQEELLHSLMENLGEGVVACDAAGKLTFFNKTAREWHGVDILQVPPERWSESFNLQTADGRESLAMDQIPLIRASAGERVRNAEMIIAAKNKSLRYVLVSGDAMHDAQGNRLGAVVVMHDITERRNAERHNLRTQRLESIGTLSGGIAHDLNNALAPILLGLELLRDRCPASVGLLDVMERSARHGAGMVKQLLTFAKGVDGERVTLQVRPLIKEIAEIIESTFPKNIGLNIVTGDQVWPVLGDATQIHQVLLNLCVNARDAMPQGGTLTIRVENRIVDALYASSLPDLIPGKFVCIGIEDTGTGISPEIIERIFEPFFTTKAPDRGTGLGLSTVIGIVRSHGGCVQVSSTLQVGTQFSVYLPEDRTGSVVSRSPFNLNGELRGNGRTILVVEDETNVREITSAVLTALDFKVITARDGQEALARLSDVTNDIALIMVDFHMPKMDGLGFVTKLRELGSAVPIVLCSGRMESGDASRFSEVGIHTLLHKPFSQGDLIKALKKVIV